MRVTHKGNKIPQAGASSIRCFTDYDHMSKVRLDKPTQSIEPSHLRTHDRELYNKWIRTQLILPYELEESATVFRTPQSHTMPTIHKILQLPLTLTEILPTQLVVSIPGTPSTKLLAPAPEIKTINSS